MSESQNSKNNFNEFIKNNLVGNILFFITIGIFLIGFIISISLSYKNKDNEFYQKFILILGTLSFFSIISWIIYFVIFYKPVSPTSSNDQQQKQPILAGSINLEQSSNQVSIDQLKSLMQSMSKGERGPSGPQGNPGPSGGLYQWQGPLRNQNHTNLRLERMYGVGPASLLFLNDQSFSSSQTWLLNSKNQIQSQYNNGTQECLKADPVNKSISMDLCNDQTGNPKDGTQFSYNQYGQFQSLKDNKMCMDLLFTNSIQGSGKIVNNQNNDSKEVKSAYALILGQCDNAKGSQLWTFY